MKHKSIIRKVIAGIIVAEFVVAMPGEVCGGCVNAKAEGIENETADIVDTSDWQKSVVVDFGVMSDLDEEGNSIPGLMESDKSQFRQIFGDVKTAKPIEGRGYWLYDNTTVQDVYGTTAATKQKMGFDKVVPAGITKTGDNCFKDWVFSPDGEEYSFSIDLPVGQYYMAVYTGNKTAKFDNTTCVRFNDEAFMMEDTEVPVVYDQTSRGGYQFYGDTKKEFIYVVDVKDNGRGYGTLKATFFDNTDHENSHNLSIGDVINAPAEGEEQKEHGVKSLDFYEGTANEISKNVISDKLITARLNGFEIMPLEEPKHSSFGSYTHVPWELTTGKWIFMKNDNITDRVYYVSSDPSVAEISVYGGWVNGLKLGTTTIYQYNAYTGDVSKSILIYDREDRVVFDKTEINLQLDTGGGEWKAPLTFSYYSKGDDSIEWKTSKNGIVVFSEVLDVSDNEGSKSRIIVGAVKEGKVTITATLRRDDGTKMSAECVVNVTRAVKTPTPTVTLTPTAIPTPTVAPAPTVTPTPTGKHVCIYKVKVDGKKTTTLKAKKSVTFNVKGFGTKVKKVKCTIKSGKKLVTVKTTKNAVKIKAKKRGKVKVVIKVTTTNNRTFTYKRTVIIKK